MDPGVLATLSIARVLYRYDDHLRGLVKLDETRPQAQAVATTGRALKVMWLDVPLSFVMLTISHEVFGHGARARELGLSPGYTFHLVEPYAWLFGQNANFSGESEYRRLNQEDSDLAVVLGGMESDHRTATWITRQLVQQEGVAHYGDLILYLTARLSYGRRLLDPLGGTDPADDVNNYVTGLQVRFNKWTGQDRASIAGQLRTAYVWNLLDPMLAYATYGLLIEHIGRGKRFVRAPLPRAGSTTFLPWPRIHLTPFGTEHYLDVLLLHDGVLVDAYGRLGSSHLASYGGAGIGVWGAPVSSRLKMGGSLDAWSQPATLLAERSVFERENRWGANGEVTGEVALSERVGFMVKLAYKTRGYLPAQPLGEGLYGYGGFTLRRW